MDLDFQLGARKQLDAPKPRRPGSLSEDFVVEILAVPPSGVPEEPDISVEESTGLQNLGTRQAE